MGTSSTINDWLIVGRVHQPPPVHQTFQGDGFVVCSFCPRPFDLRPEWALPAPYNHSNVDSDRGPGTTPRRASSASRKGIEFGSITAPVPDGIPHGPHPGRAEASIGAKPHERARGDDGLVPAAQGCQGGPPGRGSHVSPILGSRPSTCSSNPPTTGRSVAPVERRMVVGEWRRRPYDGSDADFAFPYSAVWDSTPVPPLRRSVSPFSFLRSLARSSREEWTSVAPPETMECRGRQRSQSAVGGLRLPEGSTIARRGYKRTASGP